MYQLYSTVGSGGFAVEATLIEAGAAYQVHNLDSSISEVKQPKYLAINPRGQVPFLVAPSGQVITETGAIVTFLGLAHPESGLMPPAGSDDQAAVLRWTFFAAANLYEAALRYYYSDRYGEGETAVAAIKASAGAYFSTHLDMIEKEVKGPYLLGAQVSTFDFFIALLASWNIAKSGGEKRPKLAALTAAVAARPKLVALAKAHFAA